MKKFTLLMIVISLVLSFGACTKNETINNNTELDYEIGDTGGLKVPFGNGETIEWVATSSNAESKWIFEKMSEITGVNIDINYLNAATSKNQVNVMLASGDIPDILGSGVGTMSEINRLAVQGAYASVSDYIDKMPNFKRIFIDDEENYKTFKTYAADDGKIYCLPAYDTAIPVNHGMLYRKDIFDKHGLEMWNSPETFYQTLKQLKKLYPDTYPLTSKTGTKILSNYAIAWGIKAYTPYFDEETETWKYSDTDPKMKEILDYFYKLYTEKLIDPEFLTNTQPTWTQKMMTGKSLVSYDWVGRMDQFAATSDIKGYDLRYGNPVGPKQTLVSFPKVGEGGCVIANNKKAELAMKVMDFVYSDAGMELLTLGIKGQTYDIDKESGKVKYLEFPEDEEVTAVMLEKKYGLLVGGTYRRVDKRSVQYNYTERTLEAQGWAEKCGGYEPYDPTMTFSDKDSNDVFKYVTDLSKEFEIFMFKYITGTETGDEAWNKWLKKAKYLGEDKMLEIYNRRYKELSKL